MQHKSGSDSGPPRDFFESLLSKEFFDGHFETHAEDFFRDASMSRLLAGRATNRPEESAVRLTSATKKNTRARGFRVGLGSKRQAFGTGRFGHRFLRQRGHGRLGAPRLLETPGRRFR